MKYLKIDKNNINNGDGLRVVLWVSGCSNNCDECFNQVSWNPNNGEPFTDEVIEDILSTIKQKHIKGITLTGGDPFFPLNRINKELLKLCKLIKEIPNKTIWAYTGYLYEDIKDCEIFNYIDVLIDGPFRKELKDPSYLWAGSRNQRIIDIKATKEQNAIVLHKTQL
jgi:anaerobic ribonucleoside-triphosphate reductase activating protein